MLEAQHLGKLPCPLDARRGVLFGGGDDEVCRGKIYLGGVLHAGSLAACHGVAGNELHPRRAQCLHRLHKAGLYAGNIRKDAPGFDQMAVGAKPVQQRGGVQAKDDMVGLPDKVLKIVGLAAGDIAVLQRVLQMSLAAVDAVHMEAGAGQLQRVLAAQQTQTHYEITFCFIKHLLPPRQAALHLQKSRASSSGWLRRRPRSGAARRQQPAPQGS